MTVFVLKIIALVTMFLDHVKYAIPSTNNFVTQYFGRIAFPLFAFFITEGYIHTRSRKKYVLRLFIFALISQIPFMLFRTLVADKLMLNILFTFLCAILGIWIYDYFTKDSTINKFLGYLVSIISFMVIAIIANSLHVDYGWFGVCTVWIFYIFKKSKLATVLAYIALVLIYYLSLVYPNLVSFNYISMVFTILPAFLILLYNGKEGKKIKYLYYTFYPVHMLILYIVAGI